MRSFLRRAGETPPDASGVRRYRVLAFASRAEAVHYCLKVSELLESAALAGEVGEGATMWLAAGEGRAGAVDVYACDHALAAACSAGLEVTIARQAGEGDLPAARCLVLGDDRLLQG